jgi:hypothetical protein
MSVFLISNQITFNQACHNGRFWMKMSVRTSFSSGRSPAFAFTRGSGFTRGRGSASARARVPAGMDPQTRPHGPVTARLRGRVWTRVVRPRARVVTGGCRIFLGFPL